MKRLLFAAALVLLASLAHAQTITQHLVWSQVEPVATVQAWTTTVKVGAAAAAVVTPTCTPQGSGTSCNYALPMIAPAGTVVTLTETSAGGSVSGSATVPNGPNNPTNIAISVTVTVP